MALNVKYDVVNDLEYDTDIVVTRKGVYSKIFLGLFIVIVSYYVGLTINFPSYIANQTLGILLWFALIFGQYAMYGIIARNSQKAKSSLVPYLLYSVIEGLMLSYIVTIFAVIYTTGTGITPAEISLVLMGVTSGVLIISIVTGFVAAKMPVNTKTLDFFGSINRVIRITVLSVMAMLGISLLFSLFGNQALLTNYLELFYGVGPAGIAFSAIFVVLAAFGLLNAFYYVNVAQAQNAKKEFEWILATGVLANIIWLFIEVLRLALKILASSKR